MAAIEASGQGSYHRRAPSETAIPVLEKVRVGVIRYMENHEPCEESWRLLAQAEECLLHYTAAKRCLERAMDLSGRRGKRDLKKLALYREYEEQWREIRLTPEQLKELGAFLERKRQDAGLDRSFRWTLAWLRTQGISDHEGVLEGLRMVGGYNDFDVLANVVHG